MEKDIFTWLEDGTIRITRQKCLGCYWMLKVNFEFVILESILIDIYRFTCKLYKYAMWSIIHLLGLGETKDWERLDDMKEPRADHACAVVQHFYGINSKTIPPWTTGIMVSGGYRLRGAWTSSVDFLDFRTGSMKIDSFIRMDWSNLNYFWRF